MATTAGNFSKPKENKQVAQGYWRLVWWKFKRNRLAVIGGLIVLLYCLVCMVSPSFFAPYAANAESSYLQAPPQRVRFVDEAGNFSLRPFVFGLESEMDAVLRKRTWKVDPAQRYPLYFLVQGAALQGARGVP